MPIALATAHSPRDCFGLSRDRPDPHRSARWPRYVALLPLKPGLRDRTVTESCRVRHQYLNSVADSINVVRTAQQLKSGDTIDVEGDHLVVFHFCQEFGEIVIDAVSSVSARRYELHYSPDARVSIF